MTRQQIGKSLRVLYVLSGLEPGGVETWLLRLVKSFKSTPGLEVQCDFLTLLHEGGGYEPVLRGLGCRVQHIQLKYSRLPFVVGRMARLMRRGAYDIVHCQSDYSSGIVMFAARLAGVSRRVFHIHSTRFVLGRDARPSRRLAGWLLRGLAVRFSDVALCCSDEARTAFFGGNCPSSAEVLYCGIDTSAFPADQTESRRSVRAELGLPPDGKLLLCAGRLAAEKNLELLIDAMVASTRRHLAKLLLAGDGPERNALMDRIAARGLSGSCLLLGYRADVPRLMAAADAFVLPSRHEGLPLVLIEAQAAGLPIAASNVITREVVVVPELFRWLSPSDPPEKWGAVLDEVLSGGRPVAMHTALDAVRRSPFEISRSADNLLRAYGVAGGGRQAGGRAPAPGVPFRAGPRAMGDRT